MIYGYQENRRASVLRKTNSVRSKTTGSKKKIGYKSKGAPATDGDMDMGDEDTESDIGCNQAVDCNMLNVRCCRPIYCPHNS